MTETEQALAEAKRDIESAVNAAAIRLKRRTGLFVAVRIDTQDISTYSEQSRLYTASLNLSYD
jgi:hypothetical protein